MSLLSPQELPSVSEKNAINKVNYTFAQTLILGFLAGAYIAMGGLLSLIVGYGFPELSASNPGMQKILSGATFPIGLILVVIAGAELFTGNNASFISGALNKKYNWGAVLKNWVLVYFSNFAGVLFFVYFLIYLTGITGSDPWHNSIITIAFNKVSMPWHVVFLKGIGANWLVCLAIWLGLSSTSVPGKIIGLWWPVMCFATIGYEHCIANMFFVPLGILEGAPLGWSDFFLKNLIPSTLGNIVGGGLFVGTLYWYIYNRAGEKSI